MEPPETILFPPLSGPNLGFQPTIQLPPISLSPQHVVPQQVPSIQVPSTLPIGLPEQPVTSPFSPEEKLSYQTWRNLYQDPTLLLLDPIISWNNRRGISTENFLVPDPLTLSPDEPIKIRIQSDIIDPDSPLTVSNDIIDSEIYGILQESRDLSPPVIFSPKYRNMTNPFEQIGNSSFMNRAAVKLANCDAVFGIAGGAKGGLLLPKDDKPLVFADLAGAPGGFTEYLQYRFPDSYGYGISIRSKNKSLQWDNHSLERSRFYTTDGKDGSGDLLINADWMARWVLNKAPMSGMVTNIKLRQGRGVDLVLADGSIDPTGKEKLQERYNFPLLIAETLTALQIIWKGGNFFLKFTNLATVYTADLILLITNLFQTTYIFKPISSRPGNNEFYLIAKGYKGFPLATKTVDVLRQANRYQSSGRTVSRLLTGTYPHFWKQLKIFNKRMLDRQTTVDRAKIEIYNSQDDSKIIRKYIPNYQVKYSLAYWDILSADPIRKLRRKSKRGEPFYI